jgi:hypothetical protein
MSGDIDELIEPSVITDGPLSPQGVIDQWIRTHGAETGMSKLLAHFVVL